MASIIVNGKKVYVPNSMATSEEVIRTVTPAGMDPAKRILVAARTGKNTRMQSGVPLQFKDGEKYKVVPDRCKASEFSYFGEKAEWQKSVIRSQVGDVCRKFFKRRYAEMDENCNWVVFDGFLLPEAWREANPGKVFVRMMIVFPDQYPDLPTNGFYLPSDLQAPPNSSHFFDRGYGGAFGERPEEMEFMATGNWKWYCTHIKPGAWQPACLRRVEDWRYGDNLWDILVLCTDVLSYPLED